MMCRLGFHDWRWRALPGRSLHGTDTCQRCGHSRTHCFRTGTGDCPDPGHRS